MLLGAWLPFAPAARMLARFTGVTVSAATARRQTETAGAVLVAAEDAEVARLERERPAPPDGPPVQQVTVDGVMVGLADGSWGEVKLLTIGEIDPTPGAEPKATALSYFGRRAEHTVFARAATGETHRRGTATAGAVVGVVDGAGWCQDFLDYHRPDAVRVLDFAHALGYLQAAAEAAWGAEQADARAWVSTQAHELKTGDPVLVLGALEGLPTAAAPDPEAAGEARDVAAEYLGRRLGQLRYADFQAAGYPIGSGAGESGCKAVVEARLKGAGMRWAPRHVDPLVALRGVACGGRWEAVWPGLGPALRARVRRSGPRRVVPAVRPAPPPPPPRPPAPPPPAHRPKLAINGRPTANHPWKRRPCLPGGRAYCDAHPKL